MRRLQVLSVVVIVAALGLVPSLATTVHAAGTITVTNTSDSGSGSLRQAILDANLSPGSTIDFNLGTPAPNSIGLTSGPLAISADMTITGPGSDELEVSGNHASTVVVVGVGATVSISGLTIDHGSATSGAGGGGSFVSGITAAGPGQNGDDGGTSGFPSSASVNLGGSHGSAGSAAGGGIVNHGTLTVSNTMVSNNAVTAGAGGAGGYATITATAGNGGDGGSTTNTAGGKGGDASVTATGGTGGAGGHGGGGIYNDGTLTVQDSTVTNNTATGGAGGDIGKPTASATGGNGGNGGTSAPGGNGGSATASATGGKGGAGGHGGGGIFNDGSLTLSGTTISNNTATSGNGGDAQLELTVRGGNGGNAGSEAGANGGNGGNASGTANAVDSGKGGDVAAGLYNSGRLTILTTSFAGNTATRGEFGAGTGRLTGAEGQPGTDSANATGGSPGESFATGSISSGQPGNFTNDSVNTGTYVPLISTTASPSTAVATPTLKDSATLTGGSGETGSITFTLRRGTCSGPVVDTETVPVHGNGTYSTPTGFENAAAGTYQWVASYFGGGGNEAVATTCGDEPVTVSKAGTTTSVSSSANASSFGQSVTFTATVTNSDSSASPTGSVEFFDGNTDLGAGTLGTSSGNQSPFTFSTAGLAVGNHTITATYSNSDGNFTGSSGSLDTNPQVVNPAGTTTTVTSSANPSTLGQSVTFTATVAAVAPGAGTATGTVTFTDGANTTLGTGTLGAHGNPANVATFTTSTLAVDNHTITASYGGDGNFTGSSGSLDTNPQVVNRAATSTSVSLTSGTSPSILGQSLTFTATVAAVPPGPGTPTGSVTFIEGGTCDSPTTTLATSVSLTSGTASFTTSALAVGSHTIRACYSGDTNFTSSTGSIAQLVQYGVKLLYKAPVVGKVGSSVPIKIELQKVVNGSLVNASSSGIGVTALCVVKASPTPSDCSSAVLSYGTGSPFTYVASLAPGGGYQVNVKTTSAFKTSTPYQLLFRAVTPAPGEPATIFHVDANATFTLTKA